MQLQSIDPATDQLLAEYPTDSHAASDQIVEAAQSAFVGWRSIPIEQRAECLHQLAAGLREQRDRLARLVTDEMGKTLQDALAEIEKSAGACEYFADHAAAALSDEMIATEAQKSYVRYEPLGVILGIMPWNFPVWQVIRYAAPAMMAGNTTVLKHANNVTGCALALQNLFADAGFPQGVFGVLVIDIPDVERVIQHPGIAAVTLTGSPRAGRAVAAAAGAALKKTVLELGGSDPFVILEDADIDAAVSALVSSRLLVSGQVCIAPKRIIVSDALKSVLESRLKERLAAMKCGDPRQPETDFGPLARRDLRDNVARQVDECRSQGARVVLGGEVPSGSGAFYPATLLSDVQPGMPAWDDEIFGPVFAMIAARDEEDAIRIANDTPFGLGAVIFTQDTDRAEHLAAQIDSGCCFVNTFVRSDPRLPFGGIKSSGFGREMGVQGLREFTNVKTIYIE